MERVRKTLRVNWGNNVKVGIRKVKHVINYVQTCLLLKPWQWRKSKQISWESVWRGTTWKKTVCVNKEKDTTMMAPVSGISMNFHRASWMDSRILFLSQMCVPFNLVYRCSELRQHLCGFFLSWLWPILSTLLE